MSVEEVNINGVLMPHVIVPIIGDGACLFRSLSFLLYGTQDRCQEVRERIILYVAGNWSEFSELSYDANGDNFSNSEDYKSEMSRHSVYGGYCELVAAGKVFPFLFEIYYKKELYAKFGKETLPVKRVRLSGHINSGHFDVYTPIFDDSHLLSDSASSNSKKKNKRRARYTNYTRKYQISQAAKKFAQTNPKGNQIAVLKYRQKNPDVTRAAVSAYQETHPEVNRATTSAYQKTHPEVNRATTSAYQKTHPEVNRATTSAYQKTHPEVNRATTSAYQKTHPEVNTATTSAYQKTHPEVNRATTSAYQKTHPEVHRGAAARYQNRHHELHRAAQNEYESNNPGKRTEIRLRPWKNKCLSGLAYDPAIAYENCIGTMSEKCQFCNALKWKGETLGMCCNSGKVQLAPLKPPPEPLYNLLFGNHLDHRHFIDRIRQYNGCFQMTSFGAKQIVEDGFMPTFKVQGQVYHLHGSLLPDSEQKAQFLQIYFVGEDEKEAQLRCSNYPGVKSDLVKQLQRLLHCENKYIKDLRTTMDKVPQNCANFQVIIHADRKPANAHRGCYNAPMASEVALVIVGQQFEKRDVIIQSHDNSLHRISELHRSYDPLQYPLMFCHGEDGYSIDISQCDPKTNRSLNKTVSAANFYAYRIMMRKGENNCLLRYGALFSQYVVDMYAKIETERLNYIRFNQQKLRADNYIHLKDAVGRQDIRADQVGIIVVLPSNFPGGPRYMHERAQDGMTYVRNYGSSDLFITFTCNPKWKEIQETCLPGQKHYHRPDLIARVFRRKVKELENLLIKGQLFGKVRCRMISTEWQKRGLPHVHMLLWLEIGISPSMIDKIVCAEIPDPERDPLLYDIVKANMIHGPCGLLNKNSPCMKNNCCTKRFPATLRNETLRGEDGYPKYRRRSVGDGGFTVNINSKELDNRWVVPYNPVLLRTFNAHINVEITSSVKSIKYVCKYITKGNDQAAFGLEDVDELDEIKIYESGRYISSSEAVWRILGFPIHDRYPTVTHLDVHLENGQRVYFTADNVNDRLANPPITTLLAFFELCQVDEFAKTLLYLEIPSYYVWLNKAFVRRKRGEDVEGWPDVKKDSALGRVYTIHPNNVECYHLRLLLHHVRGPTSYAYLKTVDNILYPTFKSACKALGLLEDDKQWDCTLEEAALSRSPYKMRELFSVMLVWCHLSDAHSLWEKYKDSLSEDIKYEIYRQQLHDNPEYNIDEIYNRCLVLVADSVAALGGSNLSEYGLPQPIRLEGIFRNREYLKEANYDVNSLRETVSNGDVSMTDEQRFVYQQVLDSVESNSGKVFFLDAPGGTGKTFLINLLLAKIRSSHGIALAAASTGIAATLLEGGKTAHSAFKLPLNLVNVEIPTCKIEKQSNLAKVLQDCKLIVWDESPMSHKSGFEALNNSLKDIRNSNSLMGGVTVLLAGDFRQTLPVIPRGTRANEVQACIKSSHLWPRIIKFSLTKNMRAHLRGDISAGQFSDLLLQIGDGRYPTFEGKITLPIGLCTVVSTLKDLIATIYPDIANLKHKSMDWLCERAILTTKNDTAAEINDILINSLQAEKIEYKSVDSVLQDDDAVQFPQEFLNTLNPSGFPPHKLILKIGAPIMLLRNLSSPKLCNGTRLRVTALQKNLIEATIITGSARGESVLIPRIPMIPSDYPFNFKRMQFPVKISFAMTINKSQGQSLKCAGIDLREECFSHGQFYVACSRISSPSSLVILAPEGKTTNVVYKEVLK